MKIISQLEETHKKQIPLYIEKWRNTCLLETPIHPTLFEQGIKDIHNEIGLEAPGEFLYYPSPAAIWRDFEAWKPKITRVRTQFWRYQIPLCDPSSMHRRWRPGSQRSEYNFAAKRYEPGSGQALLETEDSSETSGTVITKALHGQIWKRFEFESLIRRQWFSDFISENIDEYLSELADKEDPTSPIHSSEYYILGPHQWLLRELACVDFCHSVLSIDRNEKLYAGLESIVQNGSYCGVFGRLCVASERPNTIEVDTKNIKCTFPDGEEVSLKTKCEI